MDAGRLGVAFIGSELERLRQDGVPFIYLYTRLAFRKEKDPAQRERNRDIRRTLLSAPLLFGENLLIIASKRAISPGS